MFYTKKLLEAFETSQKARADRLIRRHSRPDVQAPKGAEAQKISDVTRSSAAAPYQRSLLAGVS